MRMHLSRIHYPITTLGPGQRVGVWFQGCSIRCAGCVSADTWAFGHGETSVASVMERIEPWVNEADGFTITGGEPFDQFEALVSLLSAIRARSSGDILVYSGYSFERLRPALDGLQGLVDALISDPYDAAAGQTLRLRGSDNQRLHFLSVAGAARFSRFQSLVPTDRHRLDVMFDEDGAVFLAGIPRTGDMTLLQEQMSRFGHSVVTSTARSLLKE